MIEETPGCRQQFPRRDAARLPWHQMERLLTKTQLRYPQAESKQLFWPFLKKEGIIKQELGG